MKKTEATDETYISNPFVQAYRAARRLLDTNKGWAIFLIILGVLGSIPQNTSSNTSHTANSNNWLPATLDTGPAVVAGVFIGSFVLLAVGFGLVIATYLTGVLSYVALQSEKGKQVSVKEALQATNQRFWRLFGALLLALLKIVGWSLLFIIPGIIAAIRYTLLGYVIMDEPAEKQSVKESHARTKEIVKGRLWEVFGISFMSVLPFIGTWFNVTGAAALYRQLQVYTDKNLEKPKIHWTNYALLLVPLLGAVTLVAIAFAFMRQN